ncbi:MAG: 2-hydroxymuconic semialdehyde dehydrogenase [Sphingomonadales bacterium]|nr:MAG: 2-hydroxymuconic semialdehyde dehydrogenase [Sphingomonadales bacterium]
MHPESRDATGPDLGQFIDGAYDLSGASRFAAVDPATGETAYWVHEATADQVDRAVQAARRALKGPWSKLTPAERGGLLRKLAARIAERSDEFLRAEILDTGKPVEMASHLDIPRGAANFNFFADLAPMALGEAFPMRTPDGGDALNYSLRTPRGVIAVICPWNLPLLLMTWKVAPALACGNTVVVKPSEETPATATLLGEVMNEVGIPAGVFNVVNGLGSDSTGEFLTKHPLVDGITFTGETVTGTAIMKAAAVGTRPVSFELGGKNPGIVFADCDVDAAVAGTIRSAFLNCGQVCLGTERLYVERPLFDTFVEKLAAATAKLKAGDPWDKATNLGPLVSAGHRDKVLGYYESARADGAQIVTGGGVPQVEDRFGNGFWIEPTIWTGLSDDSRVNREEIFGPCCHISPFDDEDEVITRSNDSPYGLAGSLWTSNLSRAHRMAGQIDVGTLWINSWFLRDLRAAFGGSKQSGIGREGGLHGLDFYTEQRNVCVRF